ncbi:MAG TPA: threonine/serine exporter family protein [Xanthomonadaceae bacterium]|nr:threonine/serine exporter family protein [Xanthomonadaceae bacterium]
MDSSYAARVAFVVELAEHLHAYGTTTQRLELAIVAVSQRLGLECEPWTNPTGMILSFSDPSLPLGTSDTTRVLRLAPGETDLGRLGEADRIAESVLAGATGLSEGQAALDRLGRAPGPRQRALEMFGFGVVAAAVAALLRLPWLDIATAGGTGLLLGALVQLARPRPRLREAEEAVAGLLAGFVVVLVAAYVGPLNQNTVIIAALIALLPGLTLTNAMSELASGHLVAGTARFSGAVMSVLKLTVGTVLAVSLAQMAGIEPEVRALRPQPEWVEWGGLLAAALSFAVLFRAAPRDYPVVMLAAAAGYLVSRYAGLAWGSPAGIFLAAFVLTAAGNGYARWWNRPGALVRVPGIIMLVPGSASLRSLLTLVQQQDVASGQVAILGVLNILAALVAGLLFGNLLISARRNL